MVDGGPLEAFAADYREEAQEASQHDGIYQDGKEDGAREEREAVVRWLRAKAAQAAGRDADEEAAALATAAAVIEDGEHRKEAPSA